MGGKQDQESLKKAIEAARKYLQMLPEDSERRPLIENYLRAMEQGKP
jgi:cytochrome c-type biogenesis protein CcmH/NrfG